MLIHIQPPEACKPGTPAENLPEEQTQVCKEMTNLETTSALLIMNETKTSIVTSERESILASRDEIQQLHKKTKLLKRMAKWQEKLNTLQATQKHSQSESLDMAIFNPTPAKWNLNEPMQAKLNEQLEIPDDINEIVALTIQLQPSVTAALEKNALHTKSTNSVRSACRDIKTDDSRPQTDKRNQFQRPAQKMEKDLTKNHKALRKEEKCFECSQKRHLTKDCLKKKMISWQLATKLVLEVHKMPIEIETAIDYENVILVEGIVNIFFEACDSQENWQLFHEQVMVTNIKDEMLVKQGIMECLVKVGKLVEMVRAQEE
ncbi:uncharacterized protein CIMG_12847 [Coccidioides immitis RS]|uniref:Uncharacterized protein n=1 Tax=Coccidioides immitis (strain RS) TaxID=246410 RepID=J3KHM1_COCIM|nr:uncharacterized protein CIMG_12847 [Coccidioides immitis RS]EAS35382.3 hypothetical protein CIMG_12847 [Coccidioides immitis RS]